MAVRVVHIQTFVQKHPKLFEGREKGILERARSVAQEDNGYISSGFLPELIGREETDLLFRWWEENISFVGMCIALTDNEEQLVADCAADLAERSHRGETPDLEDCLAGLPNERCKTAVRSIVNMDKVLATIKEMTRDDGDKLPEPQ